jgi:ABC-type uncharacterized transport system substrate-binding protein
MFGSAQSHRSGTASIRATTIRRSSTRVSPLQSRKSGPRLTICRRWPMTIAPAKTRSRSGPKMVADLALKYQLPTMVENKEMAAAGALLSLGPNIVDSYRRSATHVDKILKGAKPGDLPMEQPTKFDLFVNLKTARALGMTIPQSVLVQATQVIQ